MPLTLRTPELKHGDRFIYKLEMSFPNGSDIVSPVEIYDEGMRMKSWGKIRNIYREEDYFPSVPVWVFEIYDTEKYFYDLYFFNEVISDRKARIKLERKQTGGVYETVFLGSIVLEDTEFKEDARLWRISAIPRTDILESTSLWFDKNGSGTLARTGDDVPGKKLLQGTGTKFTTEIPQLPAYIRVAGVVHKIDSISDDDTLTLVSGLDVSGSQVYDIIYPTNPFGYTEYEEIPVQDLIGDIMNLIGLTPEFNHKWQFMGFSDNTGITKELIIEETIIVQNDIVLGELACSVFPYYFDHTQRYENLRELLRAVCLQFGSQFILSGSKAYFNQLYYDDSLNTVSISKMNLLSKPTFYFREYPIQYVRIDYDDALYIQEAGSYTDKSELKIEETITEGFFLASTTLTGMLVVGDLKCERLVAEVPTTFYVGLAKDPRLSYPTEETADWEHPDYTNNVKLLKDILYRYKGGSINYLHADFELSGLNYHPWKVYSYEGKKHIVVEFEWDLDNIKTSIVSRRIT
ncbi:MAG: hypothetical protein AMXMBFR48_15530 [Ignavibacteriales bacterium]